MEAPIWFNIENSIGKIIIQIGKGNMLSRANLLSLREIIEGFKGNQACKGILIKGSNRCFCAGLLPDAGDFFELFDKLLLELFYFPKPVVVALDGHSIGGGLLLQCCADYVVSTDSEKAKLGLPELKIDLTIDELMMSLIRYKSCNVEKMLFDGEYFSVLQAKEHGIIDAIVECDDEVEKIAIERLTKLMGYNSSIYRNTKYSLRRKCFEEMQTALRNNCFDIFEKR